eukprot:UN24376
MMVRGPSQLFYIFFCSRVFLYLHSLLDFTNVFIIQPSKLHYLTPWSVIFLDFVQRDLHVIIGIITGHIIDLREIRNSIQNCKIHLLI